ncbi:MAG: hypothetical protein K6G38_05325 [Gammaproteobacteria bacterium]|nr:hypothetical protein [Gammaproteobacteria bacterium]
MKNIKNLFPERKELLKKLYKENTFEPYGIYEINNGYIVHFELTIYKIDENGNVLWEFSGNDIFTGLNKDEDYYISFDDKSIKLHDFNDNYYILDFEGNVLDSSFRKLLTKKHDRK